MKHASWQQQRERLMDDRDLYSDRELQDRKSRIQRAMYAADKQARQDRAAAVRRGYCPKCHVALTLSGACSMGCPKSFGQNARKSA